MDDSKDSLTRRVTTAEEKIKTLTRVIIIIITIIITTNMHILCTMYTSYSIIIIQEVFLLVCSLYRWREIDLVIGIIFFCV